MPRNACVIQITPVRLIRTIANDASVVRKIYLSIDPIVTARSPPCELAMQLATNPEIGIPFGRARPAGSLSHYHPFDPSTKWLRHGAAILLTDQRDGSERVSRLDGRDQRGSRFRDWSRVALPVRRVGIAR